MSSHNYCGYEIKIIAIHIHGANSKLEDINALNTFSNVDIVCLSEIKHAYTLDVPGFICVRSKIIQGEELRDGVAVLFKHRLSMQHKLRT